MIPPQQTSGSNSAIDDLLQEIRARLRHSTNRRVHARHANVLSILRSAHPMALQPSAIYKLLLDRGTPLGMSALHRGLGLLEEAGLAECDRVRVKGPRARRFYRLAASEPSALPRVDPAGPNT